MNTTIPTEFIPRKIGSAQQTGTTNESNNNDNDDPDDIKLGSLFNTGYDSDESDLSYIIETVHIGDDDDNDYDATATTTTTTTTTATTTNSELTTNTKNNTPNHKPPPLQFTLLLPPDIGTLFAHRVWSGSKYLSRHLHSNPTIIHNKRIIEFGAGTGLPSLVSLALGCSYGLITDYPEEEVLSALRDNVGRNWVAIHGGEEGGVDRVKVMGHKWGIDTSALLSSSSLFFDVALLSECLWLHDEHPSLAKSLNDVLKPGGIALLTYAHHVPGKEVEDDSFFELCRERYGFETTLIGSEELEYMWDEEKRVTVYLKMMRKP